MKQKVKGITVVSPMWGDRSKTDRMVFSVIHQFISNDNPFKIHLVLVDDYIEKRGDNDESYYSYYISEEFKQFYDPNKIKITIVKNSEHKYQGESREIGYLAGDYDYFLLIDCDDMLAPNACDRYLQAIRGADDNVKIAFVFGLVYGFDTNDYEQLINGNSIWVQGRMYNRKFLIAHDIHFPTGINSRQGEDYPFIKKLDYAFNHDNNYICASMPFDDHDKHCQCTAYWFPNEESLSRKDKHYTQHLSGWTMASSYSVLKYFEEFNFKHGLEDSEDEFMKHEVLNMNVYAFYNLLDFLKEVSSTDYKPLEDDWYALRDNVKNLRSYLTDKYWDEIIYSDVEDMLYNVHHNSDVHFTESWIGTFYDYMREESDILSMDYKDMIKYCKKLKFDDAGHEMHSPQVKAWERRHK